MNVEYLCCLQFHFKSKINKCLVSSHYTLFCIFNGRKVYITCIDSVEKNITVTVLFTHLAKRHFREKHNGDCVIH